MTDGKMDEAFRRTLIRLRKTQKGLMRFFHPVQRGKPDEPLVLLCTGNETVTNSTNSASVSPTLTR